MLVWLVGVNGCLVQPDPLLSESKSGHPPRPLFDINKIHSCSTHHYMSILATTVLYETKGFDNLFACFTPLRGGFERQSATAISQQYCLVSLVVARMHPMVSASQMPHFHSMFGAMHEQSSPRYLVGLSCSQAVVLGVTSPLENDTLSSNGKDRQDTDANSQDGWCYSAKTRHCYLPCVFFVRLVFKRWEQATSHTPLSLQTRC